MQNLRPFILVKYFIFLLLVMQGFNSQANEPALQKADSLFATKNYQEALLIYKEILQDDRSFSPAMLLKMAFISEGLGDYPSTTLYLSKYYEYNSSPQLPGKIKELTNQTSLTGYTISDRQRFLNFLTDNSQLITAFFGILLTLILIALVLRGFRPGYAVTAVILMGIIFVSNNFLDGPETGIVTGNPSLIMSAPSAGGNLIRQVGPGHRVIIRSSTDIWYQIEWEDRKAFVKKSQISKI